MKFSDFYTNAIAVKDQGLRRLREQVERARISAIRIKRTTSAIVLTGRSNNSNINSKSPDHEKKPSDELTFTESSRNDCSSWDTNRSSAKVTYKDDIHPECFLSMDDCIRYNGFPCDVFTVETEDGFLIEIHRLRNEGKPAVLMQHGILGDTGHWVAAGPDHGLGMSTEKREAKLCLKMSRIFIFDAKLHF